MTIFVWLPTPSGKPEPQKWHDERGAVIGGRPPVTPLAEYTLPANREAMSLAQLAELYPPPTQEAKK